MQVIIAPMYHKGDMRRDGVAELWKACRNKRGDAVMVHCNQSFHRGPGLAACMLVLGGMSAEQAFIEIANRRTIYRGHVLDYESWPASEKRTRHTNDFCEMKEFVYGLQPDSRHSSIGSSAVQMPPSGKHPSKAMPATPKADTSAVPHPSVPASPKAGTSTVPRSPPDPPLAPAGSSAVLQFPAPPGNATPAAPAGTSAVLQFPAPPPKPPSSSAAPPAPPGNAIRPAPQPAPPPEDKKRPASPIPRCMDPCNPWRHGPPSRGKSETCAPPFARPKPKLQPSGREGQAGLQPDESHEAGLQPDASPIAISDAGSSIDEADFECGKFSMRFLQVYRGECRLG